MSEFPASDSWKDELLERIPLLEPELNGKEDDYVLDCIYRGYVSSVGGFVECFEREFAAFVGAPHAVACASGTAALHVALRLVGAGPGALVATSTLTFIASANAIAYTGADVLLVDSEPDTWNMDTQRLHDEVVRRARVGEPLPAVVEVVHVLGHPARMEPLLDLRERYGIRIVEDAAEALGAGWRSGPPAGRQVGTVGDVGCYSFNGNKVMTTGGGGMIVTADAALAQRAKHLTTQAKLPGPGYEHDEVGYNYRLTNVAAALGVAQLEQLPGFLARKRAIAVRYTEALEGLPLDVPPHAGWADPSFWLYSVLLHPGVAGPETVLGALAERGVQTRPLWRPVHIQKPYLHAERLGGAVAESLADRGLSLPSSAGLGVEDQDRVVDRLRGLLRGVERVG